MSDALREDEFIEDVSYLRSKDRRVQSLLVASSLHVGVRRETYHFDSG
jgi:hypothetical protein